LPPELDGCSFRNIFTGAVLSVSSDEQNKMDLADVFQDFPVALLFCEQTSSALLPEAQKSKRKGSKRG
jgi:hypothetical protein